MNFNRVTTYHVPLPLILRLRLMLSAANTCSNLLKAKFPNHQIIPREDGLVMLSANCDLRLHIRKWHRF